MNLEQLSFQPEDSSSILLTGIEGVRKDSLMLNVQFGDMPQAVYDTATYFAQSYLDPWITDGLTREMIADVDKSQVVDANLIQSPVLGPISPLSLSGGVKTLILLAHDRGHVFNISTCGDNCAKWILRIADKRAAQNQKLLVSLHHLMDFGDGPFRIRVLDPSGKSLGIAKNMVEFLDLAGEFV